MRYIPEDLDKTIVSTIDMRLDAVETKENVKILWAIESGSRAWGFPSPDSDYDCRFIYVRKLDDYLRLYPMRDVIETPLDAIFDVNGWDLAKTLKLLLSGNAAVVEWLQSTIIYRGNSQFYQELTALAERIFDRKKIGYHYFSLGKRQSASLSKNETKLKRLFYALRPAMALQWLMQNNSGMVPMRFQSLMDEIELAPEVRMQVDEMLIKKMATKEMGYGSAPKEIEHFLTETIDSAKTFLETVPTKRIENIAADVEYFFRYWIKKCDASQ